MGEADGSQRHGPQIASITARPLLPARLHGLPHVFCGLAGWQLRGEGPHGLLNCEWEIFVVLCARKAVERAW